MTDMNPWPWGQSLAALHPDGERAYAVRSILFGLVRDRCLEAGLVEGATLRCRERARDHVLVELACGDLQSIELPYAWFVQVEPASAGASAA